MFALPMETAAHLSHIKKSITNADYGQKEFSQVLRDLPTSYHHAAPPWDDLFDCINWVRVYKNPKTTRPTDLTEERYINPALGAPPPGIRLNADFPVWQVPNVETGNSSLMPSLHWESIDPMWNPDNDAIWVDFDSADDGGALIDTGPNSGLVTATENTTVKPGDRVAIAVNFNPWGGFARPDMAIGPRVDITYQRQQDKTVNRLDENDQPIQIPGEQTGEFYKKKIWFNEQFARREGPWCLNPNLQLNAGQRDKKHTFV